MRKAVQQTQESNEQNAKYYTPSEAERPELLITPGFEVSPQTDVEIYSFFLRNHERLKIIPFKRIEIGHSASNYTAKSC